MQTHAISNRTEKPREFYRDTCGKCGARRIDRQIGLEATPEAFVAKMVDVFREVRRVLRDDGTVFLNLGDSYYAGGWECRRVNSIGNGSMDPSERHSGKFAPGLKPKDLCGIPWRVAFALQADGWWLRQDIIWHKPNPMPESVTDRCTKAHEYVFLLSKSATYYYDAEAVKEASSDSNECRVLGNATPTPMLRKKSNPAFQHGVVNQQCHTRNRRSVWTIPTAPYSEAHFATFPPKLVEPMILAGTSAKGCCATCGKPWERVVERTGHVNKREPAHVPGNTATKTDSTGWQPQTRATDLWQPACTCGGEPVPCTVLDPFGGSGTTAAVALQHGRNAIICELNPEYAKLAERRIGEATRPATYRDDAGDDAGTLFAREGGA